MSKEHEKPLAYPCPVCGVMLYYDHIGGSGFFTFHVDTGEFLCAEKEE